MKKSTTSETAEKKTAQNTQLEAMNYPASQDMMNHDKRIDVDPEDIPGQPTPYATHKAQPINKEKRQQEDEDMGLDVPGAELDDADEMIGEEDEENNYYSLGGEKDEQDSDGSGGAFEGTEEEKQ